MSPAEQMFITTLELATDRYNSELDVKAAFHQAAGLFAIAVAINHLTDVVELMIKS